MVQLKDACNIIRSKDNTSFNAKMVQLKECTEYYCNTPFLLFQCQNGTIKRMLQSEYEALVKAFQCQNGTIKSFFKYFAFTLKVLFQCQNGTIKSSK